MEEPKIRLLYQHRKGAVLYLVGFAENEQKKMVCIITNLSNGNVYVRPIEMFQGEDPDFKLVTPEKAKST